MVGNTSSDYGRQQNQHRRYVQAYLAYSLLNGKPAIHKSIFTDPDIFLDIVLNFFEVIFTPAKWLNNRKNLRDFYLISKEKTEEVCFKTRLTVLAGFRKKY